MQCTASPPISHFTPSLTILSFNNAPRRKIPFLCPLSPGTWQSRGWRHSPPTPLCPSQAIPIHKFRAHRGGEDELLSHGALSKRNFPEFPFPGSRSSGAQASPRQGFQQRTEVTTPLPQHLAQPCRMPQLPEQSAPFPH